MKLNVYVFNHWVDFPSSEYGGLWVVMGSSGEAVVSHLLENMGDYAREKEENNPDRVWKAVAAAQVIETTTEGTEGAFIVEHFIT